MLSTIEQEFGLVEVERAINYAEACIQYALDYAHDLQEDPDKDNRIKQQKCLVCHYGKTLAPFQRNQSLYCKCGICKEASVLMSTTRTIAVCPDCIKLNNLCKSCGSTMDFKRKRKLKPFQKGK